MKDAMKRKLIEVALPLEAINRESEREKKRKVGKPQHIHHWWARRPITAARAALFAQLVDDPGSNPDEFPTEELVRQERERLHAIIAHLAEWESIHDSRILSEARREIEKSANGHLPPLLDPFAGGGAIPLEAQRLGLEVHASDLNPVAVIINKALIEIPPKFRDQAPVFPSLAESQYRTWRASDGLAADVRAYGGWIRDEAERRIGHLYPEATLSDGSKAAVIAWIWARTITCPNPACGIEMPLVRSWWLGKKKGRECYVVPRVQPEADHPSGKRVAYSIALDARGPETDGTVGRNGAECVACGSQVDLKHVRNEGRSGRLGSALMAVVAEGHRSRIYLSPSPEHEDAAAVAAPASAPEQSIPAQAPSFRVQAYGMTTWASLFTNRQLNALTTFSDLVSEARERVRADALAAGMPEGDGLESGGVGAAAYADAVATYLGLAGSRLADWSSSLCRWESKAEVSQQVFGQQSIPMVWDFSEARTTGLGASGSFAACLNTVVRSLTQLDGSQVGEAFQADAAGISFDGAVIHTDPPYYDNIGYSDLADFFYVWQRRTFRAIYPKLFGTILVPKAEELVANPFRHGGTDGARRFFEDGFRSMMAHVRLGAHKGYPIAVWYAFKQSEASEHGETSRGWESILDGMVRAGWRITSTWPIRSEGASRLIGRGTNALASSIILTLRPRGEDAPTTDRRGLIASLQAELPHALRELQQGAIAPVDLPQAAIGPGMAVFSRYSKVMEPDGSPMSVRSALSRINEILDQVLSEQEGDFDPATRFAIAWYRQHGYGTGRFGDADNLARARNTSVDTMDRSGVLTSRAGKVTLVKPADTPADYDVVADEHGSTWEILHHTIRIADDAGIDAAGAFLRDAGSRDDDTGDLDLLKELAFLLFSIAERNGWTKDAIAFNAVAQSWAEVTAAAKTNDAGAVQNAFDLDEEH